MRLIKDANGNEWIEAGHHPPRNREEHLMEEIDRQVDANKTLRAENARLRAALERIDEKIGHYKNVKVGSFPHVLIPLVASIAAAALRPDGEVGK